MTDRLNNLIQSTLNIVFTELTDFQNKKNQDNLFIIHSPIFKQNNWPDFIDLNTIKQSHQKLKSNSAVRLLLFFASPLLHICRTSYENNTFI